jgi:LysM repeat protein
MRRYVIMDRGERMARPVRPEGASQLNHQDFRGPDAVPARRRPRLERAGWIVVVVVLGVLLYRQLHPGRVWAIVVDGTVAAVVAKRSAAEEALAALKRNAAGAAAGHAEFRQRVSVEPLTPGAEPPLTASQAMARLAGALQVVVRGCTIKVNGEPVAALGNEQEAGEALRAVKARFVPPKGKVLRGPEFREAVTVETEEIPLARAGRQLVSVKEAVERLLAPAQPPVSYVVRAGDVAARLARQHGLTLEDLKTANPGMNLDNLRVGDRIVLAGGQPRLHVIVRTERLMTTEIPPWSEETKTPKLKRGERRVVQKGQPGQQRLLVRTTEVNGREVERSSSYREVITAPVPEKVLVGTG